jgi:hypothetical protein
MAIRRGVFFLSFFPFMTYGFFLQLNSLVDHHMQTNVGQVFDLKNIKQV